MGAAVPLPDPTEDRAFCSETLPKVSRTFALCIRLLPAELEHPILVSYLLCRVADTIEDTVSLDSTSKESLLSHFSSCLERDGPSAAPLADAFAATSGNDEILAREADAVLREFHRLPTSQQDAVRPWIQKMCEGMTEFEKPDRSIGTMDDLDRYCYYVAGTVGHLLTELFCESNKSMSSACAERLRSLATSFGLGLQLTNIIKDVGDDRRRGRSFIPRQLWQSAGTRSGELANEPYRPEAQSVMRALIHKAKRHLRDALEYTVNLPRRMYRVRLFCLTSLYFAVRTIYLAERDQRLLDPHHKVKISRRQVYRTVATTRLIAPCNSLVKAYFKRLAGGDSWADAREHHVGGVVR
ncbi:MAG: phytoene/squalene synthase family protein [Gemmatimonadales bacterium]